MWNCVTIDSIEEETQSLIANESVEEKTGHADVEVKAKWNKFKVINRHVDNRSQQISLINVRLNKI